jgi:hypothetical protein
MDDPDGYFGEPVAASYDDPSDRMFQPEAIDSAVSLLAELAGSGRALELAIGTGRIGLLLSQRGVPVHGIELSRAMVARPERKWTLDSGRTGTPDITVNLPGDSGGCVINRHWHSSRVRTLP